MTSEPSKAVLSRQIARLEVGGYKSIRSDQSIEIRPLTVLAGANSSGKSSIIQPLLLLKQTLEAPFDPGPLRLDGPNVRFNKADQLFFTGAKKEDAVTSFRVSVFSRHGAGYKIHFTKGIKQGLRIAQMDLYDRNNNKLSLQPDMPSEEIKQALIGYWGKLPDTSKMADVKYSVRRERCFLQIHGEPYLDLVLSRRIPFVLERAIPAVIHLPGLRGNPERDYQVTAIGKIFSGTFENYTASVIANWQDEGNSEALEKLNEDLEALSLTWKVEAGRLDDTRIELRVGRRKNAARGGARDLVNIADVGFGVSQVLPLLVALHVAEPGQLVYVEQPEIHLHPRAQVALASILAQAAQRGVRVVAETHSSLLLLAIQTLIAEDKLDPELVILHWFERNEDGETTITTSELDELGAHNDWPEDFGDVSLETQRHYLDAADTKEAHRLNGA